GVSVEKVNPALTLAFAEGADWTRHKLKPTERMYMQTSMTRIHDPARARAYFEDKLAFTTGPVELERWIKTGENNLVIVDVRAAQDFTKGHIPGAINLSKEKWDTLQGLS